MRRRRTARRSLKKDTSDSDSIDIESTEESEADNGKDYTVECILAEYQDEEDKLFYLLKWEDYPLLRATWEPTENIQGQSTFDEWEAQKARIEKGLVMPFDVEKFEEEVEQAKEAKTLRHRRREQKRKRLNFATPSSSNKRKYWHPQAEQIDNDSSSEAEEVNEGFEDTPGISTPVLLFPGRPVVDRAKISEDIDMQVEPLGGSSSTRPRPRRRHNIPGQGDCICDDFITEKLGKQIEEGKDLCEANYSVPRSSEKALDETLYELNMSLTHDMLPKIPSQKPMLNRKKLGAEAPSHTGYLGTANRTSSFSATLSRGRSTAVTRGLRRGQGRRHVGGRSINFTSGSASTSSASKRPRGLTAAILNASNVDSSKPKQHFLTPSMVRKAELAGRNLADRILDITVAGPLTKPSEYAVSRIRKKSTSSKLEESQTVSNVIQSFQEGQSAVYQISTDAEPFQLCVDEENDTVQKKFEAQDTQMRELPSCTLTALRAMQEEKAQTTTSTSISTNADTRNLESLRSIPSQSENTSSNTLQQNNQQLKQIKKVKFSDYRSRRLFESFGDAISIQAVFGDGKASPILVVLKDTKKGGVESWSRALNELETISLSKICIAQDFLAQTSYLQSQVFASGEIMTNGNGRQTLQRVAAYLRPLLGLVFEHQLFKMLVYPAKCEEWHFIDSNMNIDSNAPLLYRIFQVPTDITTGIPADTFQEMVSSVDLNQGYLPCLLDLTQNLQYSKLVPVQNEADNVHNFYLLFTSKGISTANLFVRWLRACDPKCRIYTSQIQGSWDFFTDNNNVNIGTVFIHHTLLPFVSKIPRLAEMMEAKRQFTFWSFGDSPLENIVKTSFGSPINRLFPHGGAIFLMPSFLKSQPKRTYDLLRWFQEKLIKSTPGTWKLGVSHNCCKYLLGIALRRASKGATSCENSTSERNGRDKRAASSSSGHRPGKFEFLNYQILDELLRKKFIAGYTFNWSRNHPDEMEGPVLYADESIDPDDEKGLATWFALWSILHVKFFRRFVLVGTGSLRASSKTPTTHTAHLKPRTTQEVFDIADPGRGIPTNNPKQVIQMEPPAIGINPSELPPERRKRNSITMVNAASISSLPEPHTPHSSSTEVASAANPSTLVSGSSDDSILRFIAITGLDKATAYHWLKKFNNDVTAAVNHYAKEQQENIQLDSTEDDEPEPLAVLNFAGTRTHGPDAPIIPSIAHEDLMRAMELYHIGHGNLNPSSREPQTFDGVDDTEIRPCSVPPSESGNTTDKSRTRRNFFCSHNSSNIVRPKINVRKDYVLLEDKEACANCGIVDISQYEYKNIARQGSGKNPLTREVVEVRKAVVLDMAKTTSESKEVCMCSTPGLETGNSEIEELETPATGRNPDTGENTLEWYERMCREGSRWEHIHVKDWETCFKILKIPMRSRSLSKPRDAAT